MSFLECCPGTVYPWCIDRSLANFTTILYRCSLLISGHNRFEPPRWAADAPGHLPVIKEWIEQGGRYWVLGEYQQTATQRAGINNLLAYLGSSMYLPPNADNTETVICHSEWAATQPLQVMEGVERIYHASGIFVYGGTPLAIYTDGDCAGTPLMSIEAIGDGYIILAGDSNITDYTSHPDYDDWNANHCRFYKNLMNNPSHKII